MDGFSLEAMLILALAVSEFLGGFDVIKSNSIYQLVLNILKKLIGKE